MALQQCNPAPQTSPFWGKAAVVMTRHTMCVSDTEPPTEPTNRWTLTQEMAAQKHLPATKSTSKYPPQSDSKDSFSGLLFLAHSKGDSQVPGGHAPHSPWSPACGPRCSGSSCCSPRCLGSSHEQGQRSQEGPPGCRRMMRSSALPCEEEMCHCFSEMLWTHV